MQLFDLDLRLDNLLILIQLCLLTLPQLPHNFTKLRQLALHRLLRLHLQPQSLNLLVLLRHNLPMLRLVFLLLCGHG